MGKRIQRLGKRILSGCAVLAMGMAGLAVAQEAVPPPPAVRTLIVEAAPETVTRQFFGRIAARKTVDLAFEIGGRLVRLTPEDGMRVAEGSVIAQLERDGLERAVARAELQFAMAERDASRARQLALGASGSQTRADDAETARDLAAVALRDARAALADATLTAPFDGLVAARLTPEHSMVVPGQPILRLHDMSETRVEIDLPERVFVAAGGLAHVRFSALDPSGSEQPLRLVAFQPDASRVGQTYRVTLAFVSGPGPVLLPGGAVTVFASLPNPSSGVILPASAVIAGNDGSASVLVLEGQGLTATLRRVGVTLAANGGTSFTVDGLAEGTEIVAAGAHRLAEGQIVRRFTGLRPPET